MDIMSYEKRIRHMARIRGKDTTPEKIIANCWLLAGSHLNSADAIYLVDQTLYLGKKWSQFLSMAISGMAGDSQFGNIGCRISGE
jgi:hypothetical protein